MNMFIDFVGAIAFVQQATMEILRVMRYSEVQFRGLLLRNLTSTGSVFAHC